MRFVLLSLFLMLAACAPLDAFNQPKIDGSVAPKLTSKEESLLRLADSTRAAGDMVTAENLYKQAVAQSKGAVRAHLALADIYRRQQRPELAVEILEAAARVQPKNAEVLKDLGHAKQAMGKTEEAIAAYDRAIASDPDDARVYNGKGVALDSLGKNKEAQAIYREGIKRGKDDVSYLQNNLALSLILSSQYDEAINILQTLMNTKNASPTVRQNLALAYGLSGDMDTAMKLGLQDLSPEEAKENVEFFKRYVGAKPMTSDTQQAVPVDAVDTKPLKAEKKAAPAKPASKKKSEKKSKKK